MVLVLKYSGFQNLEQFYLNKLAVDCLHFVVVLVKKRRQQKIQSKITESKSRYVMLDLARLGRLGQIRLGKISLGKIK